MKRRLICMPLLRSSINLLAQVYKQVAPNGALNPPLCWSAFQRHQMASRFWQENSRLPARREK